MSLLVRSLDGAKRNPGKISLMLFPDCALRAPSRLLSATLLALIFSTQTFATTPPPPPPPSAVSSSAQVTMAPSTAGMTQIKSLFDQADYEHLDQVENSVSQLSVSGGG